MGVLGLPFFFNVLLAAACLIRRRDAAVSAKSRSPQALHTLNRNGSHLTQPGGMEIKTESFRMNWALKWNMCECVCVKQITHMTCEVKWCWWADSKKVFVRRRFLDLRTRVSPTRREGEMAPRAKVQQTHCDQMHLKKISLASIAKRKKNNRFFYSFFFSLTVF